MLKGLSPQIIKGLFVFFALWCFIAVLPLPIGYYKLLRFIIFVGALLAISYTSQRKNNVMLYIFCAIGILFNPFLPVYLQKKGIWIPLDIITAFAFLYLAFLKITLPIKDQSEIKSPSVPANRVRVRDVIIGNKQNN